MSQVSVKPTVVLSGTDGNAFSIMGRVAKAMKKGGYSQKEVDTYMLEAMSGDYDHLLQVTMKYVEVE